MGDYVYAFSSGGATVHRTDDLQLMVELELPGNEPYVYNSEVTEVEAETTDPSEGDGVSADSTENSESEESGAPTVANPIDDQSLEFQHPSGASWHRHWGSSKRAPNLALVNHITIHNGVNWPTRQLHPIIRGPSYSGPSIGISNCPAVL